MEIIRGVASRVAPLQKAEPAMLVVANLPLLGVSEAVPAGLGLAARFRTTTTLFRAVNSAELSSIEANGGRLTNVAASGGGKSFSPTVEGAEQFGRMAAAAFGDGPYTVISTTINTNTLRAAADVTATVVDRGIPHVRLPESLLRLLDAAEIVGPVP